MEKCEKTAGKDPKNVSEEAPETPSPQEYQGELINIIMKIPSSTAELTITARRIENGKIKQYEVYLDTDDIFAARKDFLENVEFGDDYDAVYTLTDEGRRMAERLMQDEGSRDTERRWDLGE